MKIISISKAPEGINNFGYISLGTIKFPDIDPGTLLLATDLVGKCETSGGIEFEIFLIKHSLNDLYTVLSNFSNLPDEAMIENESLLEELKLKIQKDYMNLCINDYFGYTFIEPKNYRTAIDTTSTNYYHQGTTATTYSSGSIITKINYASSTQP